MLYFCINLGDIKNVHKFTHFRQFCLNFIGKDEVFHGLLYFHKLQSLSFDRECSAKDSEAVTDVFKAVMTEFERERGYGPSGDDQYGRYYL